MVWNGRIMRHCKGMSRNNDQLIISSSSRGSCEVLSQTPGPGGTPAIIPHLDFLLQEHREGCEIMHVPHPCTPGCAGVLGLKVQPVFSHQATPLSGLILLKEPPLLATD